MTMIIDKSFRRKEANLLKSKKKILSIIIKKSYSFFIPAVLIILWEILGKKGIINQSIMSAPTRIIRTLKLMLSDGELTTHLGVSAFRVVQGFGIGAVLGIIIHLINKEDNTIELWKTIIKKLYFVANDNIIKADIIMKEMYINIIRSIYKHFEWLKNYIHKDFFEIMDYIYEGNENASMEFYTRKLKYLLDFLRKFHIKSSNETITKICDYILNNVDSNLKLKDIAKEFYVNNTYLSKTFATKAGIGFNEYITMVKMARAEYLFINTNLKTYEVGYQLGYHDMNYFSKLFKKYYGKSPLQYRCTVVQDYQI